MADILMPLSSSNDKFDDKHFLSTSEFDRSNETGGILGRREPPKIDRHTRNEQHIHGLKHPLPEAKVFRRQLPGLRADVRSMLRAVELCELRIQPQRTYQGQRKERGQQGNPDPAWGSTENTRPAFWASPTR